MAKKTDSPNFEEKLEALEQLAEKMEEGSLSLEELLKTYEQGMKLADGLKKDLEQAQGRLQELKAGALKPMEES